MAINHADGVIATSVVFCPVAAVAGAAHAGAGWFAVLFMPAGVAVGVGIFRFGRRPVYSIAGFGMSQSSKMPKRWIQRVVALPFLLLYMILPLLIAWGGVFCVCAGTVWLVRHVLLIGRQSGLHL
jgi:hypothetical protein